MEETLKLILEEIKNVKNDISELKSGQERIEVKLDNVSSEMRSNFNFTNDNITEHKKAFEIVSNEIKGVKVDIGYLSSKTGRHDMEINNILNKIRG